MSSGWSFIQVTLAPGDNVVAGRLPTEGSSGWQNTNEPLTTRTGFNRGRDSDKSHDRYGADYLD